ncbi:class F sortase [Streptacidiphilus fuscans]|uniref:Class F sortase n=1 Tax=Streptacidiphilus fuscans TaxID=2789292 RepID=A0A931FCJ4_9ACTN|nr:class F sortase [Streptacidiphilus fuscans]MBF9068538.1 class F sortase [Streptacidiphilus fuscans]
MAHPRSGISPRSQRIGWTLVAASAVLGGVMLAAAAPGSAPPAQPSAADALPSTSSSGTAAEEAALGFPDMGDSAPTRIRIPEIAVDAPLMSLTTDSTGQSLAVPPDDNRNLAGWDSQGVTPGSIGTAVIVGHVDTKTGPAVFYGLSVLHKGEVIDVLRADRHTAEFTIDGINVYAKSNFPSTVYDNTLRPELRLITCGGSYSSAGGYNGNVVVFAHLTKDIPPAGTGSTTSSVGASAGATVRASVSSSPGAAVSAAPGSSPRVSP